MTTNDEKAIEGVLHSLYEAWMNGDADAYADHFTPEAEYVAFDGSLAKGRKAIAESHRPLFTGFLKGSKPVSEWQTIRFLTPEVAVVHGMGAILLRHQTRPAKGRRSIQTTVLVRTPEGWQIAAFQNTRYRPWEQSLLGRALRLLPRRPK